MDAFLHYGYFLFLMRWNERGPCSTSSTMDTFLHYGYFLFLMRWNERGPCSTSSTMDTFLHYGCFCSLSISSVLCVVHHNPQPSLTHLNMTSRTMRELAVNFLGEEVVLSIDNDLRTFQQCTSKEEQITLLREMREKHECLRSLKKRFFLKLFRLSGRSYNTVRAEVLDSNTKFRSRVKGDVKDSMVAFLTRPGINLKKSHQVLANEYRSENTEVTEISMRKFRHLLANYKVKAEKAYVNNVYHASGTCLDLDA